MKGKTKLGITLIVLALAAVFVVSASLTQAHPEETSEDTNAAGSDVSSGCQAYSKCGGIEGCRTTCGCGCGGNPTNCGCGV